MTATLDTLDLARVEEFAGQVATDVARASAAALTYVGDRLGLYAALATGPTTSAELADRTGYSERYLREWLSAQVAVGYIRHVDGLFHLPAEHAAVLADHTSPADGTGGFETILSFWLGVDRLAESIRTGTGISWGDHDAHLYSGVDRFFQPLYQNSLVPEWLPALDGIVDRLTTGASVLDVGCGQGNAALIMAKAFPASHVHGIDVHDGSIAAARTAADRAGVADRTTFEIGTATAITGRYDLICYFDAFHHVGDPVAAARSALQALRPDGTLMLVEPRAGDRLEDNTDLVGLTYLAASVHVCVPDALAQGATDALGGQAGPARLTRVLTEAGFSRVRIAAEAPFNLVVEARP